MRKKIFSIATLIILLFNIFANIAFTKANNEGNLNVSLQNETTNLSKEFTQLRDIDKWTFNEYRYRMTKDYFNLRQVFKVDWVISSTYVNSLLNNAREGLKYLPNSLINDNNYNNLKTALERWLKNPESEAYYSAITKALQTYVEKPDIKEISWSINYTPNIWNAPLTTTFRANVSDWAWTRIPDKNYTWWIDDAWRKKIIWTWPYISYTFRDEWNFSVFLDVRSAHKNSNWYTDVLPFFGVAKVEVRAKIASLIIRVGNRQIPVSDELKFSPDEAKYWLIFDATSSVPSTWTKFLNTDWDFWNGIKKSYSGSPQVHRVVYATEWDYSIIFKVRTNQWEYVDRKFKILIRKPIATIESSQENWYLWDKFVFKAEPHWDIENLRYTWEIIDLKKDKVIFSKSWNVINYSFTDKWRYWIRLVVTDPAWNIDVDTKSIYINSRAPVAEFSYKIPQANKPNTVLLDGSKSYDLDYTDDGKLKYSWIIDWQKVNLENPNSDGSVWFYTFDSVWEHSVVLEVEDPDSIVSVKKSSVSIDSLLSVDFATYPRVIQREWTIRFLADAPEAKFFEWDFGDWQRDWWVNSKINHSYKLSWMFTVKLTVKDSKNNSNVYFRTVYIWDSNKPVSVINLSRSQWFDISKEEWACNWNEAYVVSRVDDINFSWAESINIDWTTNNLSYSWKIWNDKFYSTQTVSNKFSEVWCFPVKLTVKSNTNSTIDAQTIWIKVKNEEPTLSALSVTPVDISTDPVIVNLKAENANDKDWVIQSYLWYYYTDFDREPQDFRITNLPTTSFVLPKVPWNYYFVSVLKDNNEARINSEEKVWKYSLTLTWDNVNTPLIDFSVNDSSITVWEEVIFTAKATNVVWQNVEKTSKFSWDFDGDWFYDKETTTPTTTHRFNKSWEIHPKVKVTNKWFSNTRTLTVNVSNELVPQFDYISIWNKYIFLNKSKGQIENSIWDLWDWNSVENKDSFIHIYKDNKSSHRVELAISEWTNIKRTTVDVKKDVANILKIRWDWLKIFTSPAVDKDWGIVLDAEEKVFVYALDGSWNAKYYGIDYDISIDSDLNWWKDDDADNKNNISSYSAGEPDIILLNEKKTQKIRIFILDENKKLIDSKDLLITKNYIKEELIDLQKFKFEWVSEQTKISVEKIKKLIEKMPEDLKLKSSQYVQKLQENRLDTTERTRTLVDFANFLANQKYENFDEMNILLESLITEWQEDKNWKILNFWILKWLIPDSVTCESGEKTCKDFLISKLEEIKQSEELEKNKLIWKEVLQIISTQTVMTDTQKLDFKAIMQEFVYGKVQNIPESEKEEVQKESEKVSEPSDWKFMSFLKKVWIYWLYFLWVIILIMIWMWIWDFFKNRKNWDSFEDFVNEKTSDPLANNSLQSVIQKTETKDISSMFPEEDKKEEVNNIIQSTSTETETKDILSSGEEKTAIPDWLWKVQTTPVIPEPIPEKILPNVESLEQNIIKTPEIEIPSYTASKKVETETISTPKLEKQEENIEEVTKVETNAVPDWLKNSLTDKLEKKQEFVEEPKFSEEIKLEKQKEIKTDDLVIEEDKVDFEADVPDWLKWSLDLNWKNKPEEWISEENSDGSLEKKDAETKDVETKDVLSLPENSSLDSVDIPDWLKTTALEEPKKEKKKEGKKPKKDDSKDESSKTTDKKADELWDDGMKVPDWLKTDHTAK